MANEYCPVMTDKKVEADIWLDYQGQRVYFCHEVCKTRFQRSPAKYLANLPPAMRQAISDQRRAESSLAQPTDIAGHDHGHDHSAERQDPSTLARAQRFLGQFHPLAVHLPIGLLIAAALAEALFMWTRAEWLSGAARFGLLLGALGAVGAAGLGWLNAMSANYDGDLARMLEYHRWLGTATAILGAAGAALSEAYWRRPSGAIRLAYRLALFLAVAAVGLAGHFGGTLVYGVDYYKW